MALQVETDVVFLPLYFFFFMVTQRPCKQMSMTLVVSNSGHNEGSINLCRCLAVDVSLFYGVRVWAAWSCLLFPVAMGMFPGGLRGLILPALGIPRQDHAHQGL